MGNIGESLANTIFGSIDFPVETATKVVDAAVDIQKKAFFLAADVSRSSAQLIDNTRTDVGYTIRDIKHEGLTFLDATLDNLAIVVDRQSTNFWNTVQIGTMLSGGILLFFMINYGDKVLQDGVKFGKLNII